jgi:hypothetical protein
MYVRRRGRGFGGLGQTSTASVQQMIVDAANQYGVPPSIALGIAAHESGFNPNALNNNTNGTTDYGVMQLNTLTLQTYGVSPADALDPQTNIDTGVSLLGSLLQKYNGNTTDALWAYANGSGNVNPSGNPPAATQSFINYVTSYSPPATLALSTDDSDETGDWWETEFTDPLNADLSTFSSSLDDSGDSSGGVDPVLLAGGVVLAALALYLVSA